MKLKIVEVLKTYDTFTMDNGGKIFSIGAVVESDGAIIKAKVRSFKDTIKLDAGATYTTGDNCENIKQDTETYQNKTYPRFSVYAKKSEYKAGGGSGWKAAPKISVKEFETMIAWCDARARNLAPDAQLCWSYFATLLKTAERVDWSDKPTPIQAQAAFEDVSQAANAFDDSSIPF